MVQSAVLGFPRMGSKRQLKTAVEKYWKGTISKEALLAEAKALRSEHWLLQKKVGIDFIPSNDFAFYDHVLDHSILFNAIPERYDIIQDKLDQMFAMGRGCQDGNVDVPSQEMVKWFDSNYHYMRPEISSSTQFKLAGEEDYATHPIKMYKEAKQLGVDTRPVLLGPISYLYLAKSASGEAQAPLSYINQLVALYVELLNNLNKAGAEWVQIDEPILVYDLGQEVLGLYEQVYKALSQTPVKLMFTTYFGEVESSADFWKKLDVAGLHFDLVRSPEQFELALDVVGSSKVLEIGVVDGRNVWLNNLKNTIDSFVMPAVQKLGSDRVIVATSSSLLHTPHSLASETQLSAEVKSWFAFASEKVAEVALIAIAAQSPEDAALKKLIENNTKIIESRAQSPITKIDQVRQRVASAKAEDYSRPSEFLKRKQEFDFDLPKFPTTTIGSFPQTTEIRLKRSQFQKGKITPEDYEKFIKEQIDDCIRRQESIGLDVLVHGEPERNDMVQYFGELMTGFAFTQNGWVQSYGSRCVRPPIIIGDVSRPKPMTVKEAEYAQSQTKKLMKGMLTGPVTIVRWSFPRDDVSQDVQFKQIALALRDEVADLEAAKIRVIQVDEPALREGLPLRKKYWDDYLKSAVDSFRLATAVAANKTQIHSHFCYSDFNDIFDSIKALDADVISIEASKSDLKLMKAFKGSSEKSAYQAYIGPGVYDIHSPRVPSQKEIEERVALFLEHINSDLLWINPDCGLKTRNWTEVEASLKNMVNAAKTFRQKYA